MTINLNLDELERLARAEAPRQWETEEDAVTDLRESAAISPEFVLAFIARIRELEAQLAQSPWVPCSSGEFPARFEKVMVAWNASAATPVHGAPFCYVTWYDWMERGGVTHWMRLPPLPTRDAGKGGAR